MHRGLVDHIPLPARLLKRKASLVYRQATSPWRALPDFVVIGAQKAGTSALFEYLRQHPHVGRPWTKELHYFDRSFDRGERWYRARFPLRSRMPREQIVGEASPSYLLFPAVPCRIRAMLPQVKLIALLRDPTERAISHYFHEVRHGRETLPMLQAFREEPTRIGTHVRHLEGGDGAYIQPVDWFSYLYRGVYVDHIRRYHETFARDQLLILSSQDLRTRTADVLGQVFEFLGIDPTYRPSDVKAVHVGTNKQQVSDDTYAFLREYFRPYNQRLYEYLGRDFGWP